MKLTKHDLCLTAGEKLRAIRKEFRLTSPEMADRLRLKPNNYRKNETGVAFPNPKTLHLLVTEFDISLDWFFFDRGPRFFKVKNREHELEQEVAELRRKLEEAEKANSGDSGLPPDVKELVDQMAKTPVLHYEILAQYHRFKMNHKIEFPKES